MRKTPRLTDSQRQAVETVDRSVLVSASAGTGKTHVLAERCVHLVCDAARPCDVDRLLVVTFTEAAAGEMRTRIGEALRRRLDAGRDDPRLRRQLALLDAATITTIHAFCLKLVRQWFARLDLDPNVEVMDADEAELVRGETLDDLFADLYAGGPNDALAAGFRGLVDAYGVGRDRRIARTVLDLHAFLRSLPDPQTWMDMAERRVTLDEDADAIPRAMAELRREMLLDRIEVLGNAAALEGKIIAERYPAGQAYAHRLETLTERLRAWFRRIRDESNDAALDDVIAEIAAYKPDRVSSARNLDDRAKADRQAAKALADRLHKRFQADLQKSAGALRGSAVVDGLRRIAPHVGALLGVTKAFDERYTSAKRNEGRVDFGDLERLAFDLLSADPAGTTPSEVALRVQADFEHVLVDEFQDVNPLQEAVIRLASRETDPGRADNLFAVGDVKQSIYRFRLAEPAIFTDRAERFRSAADDGGPGLLMWLRENFRSRREILDGVNAVFGLIMAEQLGGTAYDESAELVAGTEYPTREGRPSGSPPVELHLIEQRVDASSGADEDNGDDADRIDSPLEWDAVEREALLAGQRILELTGMADGHAPMTVCRKNPDPDGPPLVTRPIELRDVVILLRATKGKANHFERVLRDMGIAVYADLTTGYFTSIEVQDVLSLLSLIDDARQDIPLAAVLRSPILDGRLSESQLVEICLHDRSLAFHLAACAYAENGPDDEIRRRLTALFGRLADWRGRFRRQPLPDVLWQILIETGYWAYVGGLHNGLQRRANLIRLHERGRQFGRFARQGLHRFLRFIEELQDRDRDFGVAPAVGEADDVVRIMSIHRSKGLEFPVVILPDLGKGFNLQDTHGTMLFDRDRHLGLSVVDPEQGVRYPTLSQLAVADRIGRQIRAEEMRLFYVAMTRAREHAIMIGTTPLDRVERVRERGRMAPGSVPLIDVVAAGSTLDWVLPAAAAMGDRLVDFSTPARPEPSDGLLFSVHQHDADAIATWTAPDKRTASAKAKLDRFADLKPLAKGERDDASAEPVIQRITQRYPHEALGAVPAVVAASELKRRFVADHEADERRSSLRPIRPQLRKPRLADLAQDDSPTPTASELGTLTHLVLEHLDLTRPCDATDVAKQVDEMVDLGLLSKAERGLLAFDALAWVFETELGRQLLADPSRVRREVPFVLGLAPGEVMDDPELRVEADDDERVIVRGMIDCLLSGEEGEEIIDFKTDAVTSDVLADRAAHYRGQIEIYTRAVREIWQRPVAHRWLVFLSARQIVEVPRASE